MSWQRTVAHGGHRRFTDVVLNPDLVGPELEELERNVGRARGGSATLTLARPAATAVPAAPTITRRDQADLGPAEQAAFKNAVSKLVADGTYRRLVADHMDMSHNMHGSMSAVGLYRFLPWHRRYLVEFERALIAADRVLRPEAATAITTPYWRWSDPFPAWLNGFLPAPDPATGAAPAPRKLGAPPQKPTAQDVTAILEEFRRLLANRDVGDYVRFTFGLEGWARRPDGSPLPAHNHVHDWVGAIMSNPSTSPTDPVFWLHHAQVDRLWHIWQARYPGQAPPLSGAARVMDPWSETFDDLTDIAGLGYAYASDQA